MKIKTSATAFIRDYKNEKIKKSTERFDVELFSCNQKQLEQIIEIIKNNNETAYSLTFGKGCGNITNLDISGVENIDRLHVRSLDGVENINLSGTLIDDINLDNLNKLKSIDIADTNIDELDITNIDNLETLYIDKDVDVIGRRESIKIFHYKSSLPHQMEMIVNPENVTNVVNMDKKYLKLFDSLIELDTIQVSTLLKILALLEENELLNELGQALVHNFKQGKLTNLKDKKTFLIHVLMNHTNKNLISAVNEKKRFSSIDYILKEKNIMDQDVTMSHLAYDGYVPMTGKTGFGSNQYETWGAHKSHAFFVDKHDIMNETTPLTKPVSRYNQNTQWSSKYARERLNKIDDLFSKVIALHDKKKYPSTTKPQEHSCLVTTPKALNLLKEFMGVDAYTRVFKNPSIERISDTDLYVLRFDIKKDASWDWSMSWMRDNSIIGKIKKFTISTGLTPTSSEAIEYLNKHSNKKKETFVKHKWDKNQLNNLKANLQSINHEISKRVNPKNKVRYTETIRPTAGMLNGIINGLCDEIIPQLLRKDLNAPQYRYVCNSLNNILEISRKMEKAFDSNHHELFSLQEIINEELYQILRILSPYQVEDYCNSITAVQKQRIKPLENKLKNGEWNCSQFPTSCGMSAITYALSSVSKPNDKVAEIDPNLEYFEVKAAFKGRLEVVSNNTNILFVTLNPSTPIKVPTIENIIRDIEAYIKLNKHNSPISLIIDSTIENGAKLNMVLEKFQKDISDGTLNILLCKSMQKYASLSTGKIMMGNVTLISGNEKSNKPSEQIASELHSMSARKMLNPDGQLMTFFNKHLPNEEIKRVKHITNNTQFVDTFCMPNIPKIKARKGNEQAPLILLDSNIWDQKYVFNKILRKLGIAGAESFGFNDTSCLIFSTDVDGRNKHLVRVSVGLESKEFLVEKLFATGHLLQKKQNSYDIRHVDIALAIYDYLLPCNLKNLKVFDNVTDKIEYIHSLDVKKLRSLFVKASNYYISNDDSRKNEAVQYVDNIIASYLLFYSVENEARKITLEIDSTEELLSEDDPNDRRNGYFINNENSLSYVKGFYDVKKIDEIYEANLNDKLNFLNQLTDIIDNSLQKELKDVPIKWLKNCYILPIGQTVDVNAIKEDDSYIYYDGQQKSWFITAEISGKIYNVKLQENSPNFLSKNMPSPKHKIKITGGLNILVQSRRDKNVPLITLMGVDALTYIDDLEEHKKLLASFIQSGMGGCTKETKENLEYHYLKACGVESSLSTVSNEDLENINNLSYLSSLQKIMIFQSAIAKNSRNINSQYDFKEQSTLLNLMRFMLSKTDSKTMLALAKHWINKCKKQSGSEDLWLNLRNAGCFIHSLQKSKGKDSPVFKNIKSEFERNFLSLYPDNVINKSTFNRLRGNDIFWKIITQLPLKPSLHLKKTDLKSIFEDLKTGDIIGFTNNKSGQAGISDSTMSLGVLHYKNGDKKMVKINYIEGKPSLELVNKNQINKLRRSKQANNRVFKTSSQIIPKGSRKQNEPSIEKTNRKR